MTPHLPMLIVIVPLLSAILIPLAALRSVALARSIMLVALISVSLFSALTLSQVIEQGTWHYALGGWEPPWGIEYVIDTISGGMACLIAVVALLVAIYMGPHVQGWSSSRTSMFYSVFLLLVTGLMGMVLTGDVFNLYVFLEISSLASYALLSTGGIRSAVATFRYLLIGTLAATFYLIGIGYLYALTGTLNMADMAARLPAVAGSPVFIIAVGFIVVGLSIKAALFPMHGWLPDAYTYAPGPVVGFISAVMTKVSAYALFRVLYFVLRPEGAILSTLTILSWAAAFGILAGSILAVAQQDIRRMLAYSSIGQMGYILLGLALATPTAITGALLHVFNHAIMKACLFLIAGGVHWQTGHTKIEDFIGLSRRMPWTMAAFVVAALSMIGLPPTAGFFSKWYLVTGALESDRWFFIAILVTSSLLNAVYFFRIIEVSYLRQPESSRQPEGAPLSTYRELPIRMLMPILLLATGVIVIGLLNQTIVTQVIQAVLPLEGP